MSSDYFYQPPISQTTTKMTSNKKLRIVKVQIPKDSMWQEALAREVASLYYLDIAWHQMIGRMESLTLPDIQGGDKIHKRNLR